MLTNEEWRQYLAQEVSNSPVYTDLGLPPAFVVVQAYHPGPVEMVALHTMPVDGTLAQCREVFDQMVSDGHVTEARDAGTPLLGVALYALANPVYDWSWASPHSPVVIRKFDCLMQRRCYWEATSAP